MSIVTQPYFHDERAALVELERLVWPTGPVCPHCGAADRIGSVVGKGARLGLKFCCRCRKQFRATLGTIFEGSHVPLHKWFQACFLLAASNDRISAHQLHLRLEVTNKTALCMVRRLREALCATAPGSDEGAAAATGRRREAAERPRPRWRNRNGPRPLHTAAGAGDTGAAEVEGLPWVKPPPGAPRQFLGFLEVARELGCDEDRYHFAAAVQRVVTVPGRVSRTAPPGAAELRPSAAAPLWPLPQLRLLPLPEEAARPPAGAKPR